MGVLIKRVTGNFLWTIISELSSKVPIFFMYVYLARVLGVENYGVFSAVQAVVFYFWLAVDLGTSMYGIKELAQNREDVSEIVSSLVSLRLVSGVAVYVFFVFSSYIYTSDPVVLQVCGFLGLYLIVYSVYPDWILKGVEQFKYIAHGNFLTGTSLIIFLLVFVESDSDVISASLVWSLTYAVGSLYMWYVMRKSVGVSFKISLEARRWLLHLRSSLMFTVNGGLVMLYQYMPLLLIGMAYGAYEIGLFSSSYKLIFAICTIGFYLPMASYPVISSSVDDEVMFGKIIGYVRVTLLFFGALAGLITFIYSERIILVVYGEDYLPASTSLSILSIAIPLAFVRYSYGIPLAALGLQKLNVKGSALALISVLGIGLILVPELSLDGASLAVLVGELTYLIVLKTAFDRNVKSSIKATKGY